MGIMTLGSIAISMLLSGQVLGEATPHGFPNEVNKFIERRDLCDHFRGEIPGDRSERATEVNRQLQRYCPGTDRELRDLRSRYRDQPEVVQKLSKYEDCIEGGCTK